jgi:hypothetical protein
MPAFMRCHLVVFMLLVAALGAALGACGKEIGDSCGFSTDCSPNGDRLCIDVTTDKPGYCTILGCDYSTCPGEAACVRFFTGNFENKVCDPTVLAVDCDPASGMCCSADELCSIAGHCVPRSSEVRYCMRTCDSDGDCRDGYECRDLAKMKAHGGEPVLAPKVVVDSNAPKFCAVALP